MKKTVILLIMLINISVTYSYDQIGKYYEDNIQNVILASAIETDQNGNVYIADYSGGKIVILDKKFNFLKYIEGFKNPSSVTVYKEKIYITESNWDRIRVYNTQNKTNKIYGKTGMQEGEYNHPGKIYTFNDELYIFDEKNYRIQIFNQDFVFKREILLPKLNYNYNAAYTLNYSMALLNQKMYVLDRLNQKVYILDKKGNIINNIDVERGCDEIYASSNVVFCFNKKESKFIYLGKTNIEKNIEKNFEYSIFQFSKGVCSDNKVYCINNNKIDIIDVSTGKIISENFIKKRSKSEYVEPVDVKKDSLGNIFVLDKGTGLIIKYDPNGKYISEFINCGLYPTSMYIDKFDNVYVAVAGESKVKKYDSFGNFIYAFGTKDLFKSIIGSDNKNITENKIRDLIVLLDKDGFINVLDNGDYNVKVFNQSFVLKKIIGKKASSLSIIKKVIEKGNFGWDESTKNTLTDFAISDEKIYILDNYYNKINIYGKNGFEKEYNDNFSKNGLTGIEYRNGYIYVCDSMNFKINKYTSDLKKVKEISTLKWGLIPLKISGNLVICKKVSENYKESYYVIKLKENML